LAIEVNDTTHPTVFTGSQADRADDLKENGFRSHGVETASTMGRYTIRVSGFRVICMKRWVLNTI